MTTPARVQYLKIKEKYQDEILFFRMGDFYETFDNDAKILSKELQIALTSKEMGKGNKVPLAGIPYHAINNYLPKLINLLKSTKELMSCLPMLSSKFDFLLL